jgi:hypothetical protein
MDELGNEQIVFDMHISQKRLKVDLEEPERRM